MVCHVAIHAFKNSQSMKVHVAQGRGLDKHLGAFMKEKEESHFGKKEGKVAL